VQSRLTQLAKDLVNFSNRRDHAPCERDDLDTANVVYKVKLAAAVASEIQKAAAPLSVQLKSC